MFKQLLQAIIDRIKPCQHEWLLEAKMQEGNRLKQQVYRHKWIYRCAKCCEFKRFKS